MRLSIKSVLFGAVTLTAILVYTGCAKDEGVKPTGDSSLQPRGLINGSPQNTALYGLSANNEIVTLVSGPPATIQTTNPITGMLRDGETMKAIDNRRGTIYGISSESILYRIKPTGGSEPVTGTPLKPLLTGSVTAFDYNPSEDRIRIMTDGGQNLRVNPNNSLVTTVDPAIPPPTVFNSIAYTQPSGFVSTSILYEIDATNGLLWKQGKPATGIIEYVAPLQVVWYGEGGFDLTSNNIAWTVQYGHCPNPKFPGTVVPGDDITQDAYRLYTFNLKTGGAVSYGRLATPLIGITAQ
ncbi:MAG TPA: DUF4394 domain-containing protein [Saprospiraceae bacterium]|nr:DUF4394 domain-containing protein [Saprospiraceae bacterium]